MPQGRFVRIARRFTEPASPASLVPALGDRSVAVFIDPHPSTRLEYVLQVLDALARSGHEEVALGGGQEGPPGAPVGMRLDGRPVPDVLAKLPAVPRSDGPAGIDLTENDAFSRFADGRALDRLAVTAQSSGGRLETADAIVRQLAVWARTQDESYAWSAPDRSPVWATGIVLLTYLSAGRTHRTGEYQRVVRGGLWYLKQRQAKDGRFSTDPVDHAVATWAMAKAYHLTRSPLFRQSTAAGLAAFGSEGGPWAVLARAEGALEGLVAPEKNDDVRAALREALAPPIPESDPRRVLSLASKWLFPATRPR
jgi:hypothetical protein